MDYTKETNIIFTQHILERYVERTLNKIGSDAKQFIIKNEEQIKNKILKLYEYSELLWYGKIKNHELTYFLINRDGWIIIIDKDRKTLITIYKVDLGLSTEFNKKYIEEIKVYVENELNKIVEMKNNYEKNKFIATETISSLKESIKSLKSEISIIESKIKLIEDGQQVDLNTINLKEKQLQQKMETFIGAKIFEKSL